MKQIGLSLALIITTLLALLGMLDAIGCTDSHLAAMTPIASPSIMDTQHTSDHKAS